MDKKTNPFEFLKEFKSNNQLIDQYSAQAFIEMTESAIEAGIVDQKLWFDLFDELCREKTIDDLDYNKETKVGRLPVIGMLTCKPIFCWWAETTSYLTLEDHFQLMVEAGAKTIVLDVDSGGGLAYGVFETASKLRRIADENDIKMIAYVDGRSCSAAYALTCVCHEVILNPDAEAGSIGVMVCLTDWSEYDKKHGIKSIYITAGKGKVPFDDDGSFTAEFKEEVQKGVDKTYSRFTNHVAENRDLTQDQIIDYGAVVFDAEEALERKLIDNIMTRDDFKSYLNSEGSESSTTTGEIPGVTNLKENETIKNMAEQNDTATLDKQLADLTAKLAEIETQKAALNSELEAQKQAVEAANKQAQESQADAKAAKLKLRETALEAVVGTSSAKELAESLELLSDEAFSKVVASYQKQNANFEEEAGGNGESLSDNEPTPKTMSEYLTEKIKEKQQKGGK